MFTLWSRCLLVYLALVASVLIDHAKFSLNRDLGRDQISRASTLASVSTLIFKKNRQRTSSDIVTVFYFHFYRQLKGQKISFRTVIMSDGESLAVDPARQILDHSSMPAFSFAFSNFLKREYRFGLDPNRPLCKAFLQGHCPLGNLCPDRHVTSTTYSKYVVRSDSYSRFSSYIHKKTQADIGYHYCSLVCKHWLRGLCKKGDACEFLHEFNL